MKKSLFFLLILLSACQQSEPAATSGAYFDLKGYFEGQKIELKKANPTVDKTVSKGSSAETKQIKIRNWESELASFISSDINKPAWKNSYEISSGPSKIRYTAKEPKLHTRTIEIVQDEQNEIKSLLITNETDNALYSSTEHLEYYPDSLYRISKKQKVIFIGTNNYTVTGRIIK